MVSFGSVPFDTKSTMGVLETIFLGLLQGVTEFLPVSSSAHLVAAQALLDVNLRGTGLEVALHFGTLVAIVVVFWRELTKTAAHAVVGAAIYLKGGDARAVSEKAPLFTTALAIIAGSIPVAVAAALFGEEIERFFEDLAACGMFLMLTGLVLLLCRFAPKPRTDRIGPARGFLIGIAQAVALLPGISRSGATITAGCFLGADRRASARFSFLLAVPALVGAAVWQLGRTPDSAAGAQPPLHALALGILVSAVVGAACLLSLLRIIERGRLHWFAAYCLPAGALMAAAGYLS